MNAFVDFCPTYNDKIEMIVTFRRSSKKLFAQQHIDAIVNEINTFVTKHNKLFNDTINAQYVVDTFKNAINTFDDEYSEYEQHIYFTF